jgi:peptide/nickel transport system substrate-binding protein
MIMFRRIVFSLTFLFLFIILAGISGILAANPQAAPVMPLTLPLVDPSVATLDVCLSQEPETLYLYGGNYYPQAIIFEALYDGPMDNVAFTYQPVILQQIPTLDNGGATLQAVSVPQGQFVVNDDGEPVMLEPGQTIRPSGCFSSACAIVYGGGAVMMDQFVVTFDLLSGLTWADGTALTANDSLYSYNLAGHPDTPTNKFVKDRTFSYAVNSDTQVQWTGLPGFIDSTYFLNFWTPLPEHLWGTYTAAELLTEPISSQTPLGYGPYLIDEWVAGSHVALHANPYYFRSSEGLPAFDQLIVHFSTNLEGDMLAGDCDIAPVADEIPVDTLNLYEELGLLQLVTAPGTTYEHMDFGIQPASYDDGWQPGDRPDFFSDGHVRRAFAYCLDRQTLADTLYAGHGTVLHAYVASSHPYYPADATEYPFDPGQGRALLEAAGWVDDDNIPTTPRVYSGSTPSIPTGTAFSVNYWTTNATLRMEAAALIAADFLNHCGIQLNLQFWAASEFFSDGPDGPVFGRQFDLATYAWVTGNSPPCDLYHSTQIPGLNTGWGGYNNSGYSNVLYDNACDTALASLTEADKLAHHQEAIRIFTQDLPILPLFQRLKVGAAAPTITGFVLDTTENYLWNIEEIGFIVESAEIPTAGGNLASPTDQTTYTIPSGTFTDTVTLTHTPVFFLQAPDSGKLVNIQHTFENSAVFTANGLPAQPAQPYTLEIQYTQAEVGPVIENTLALYYWDGFQWVMEPTSNLTLSTNTLTATPDHFSLWAVMGETHRIFIPVVNNQ